MHNSLWFNMKLFVKNKMTTDVSRALSYIRNELCRNTILSTYMLGERRITQRYQINAYKLDHLLLMALSLSPANR